MMPLLVGTAIVAFVVGAAFGCLVSIPCVRCDGARPLWCGCDGAGMAHKLGAAGFACSKGSEWRPMSTAPLDGRAIMVVNEILDRAHRAQIAFWRGDGIWLSEDGHVLRPTHWMPLPEPPK